MTSRFKRALNALRGKPHLPDITPPSMSGRVRAGGVTVSNDSALRSSAVWSALRLRADLVSTMPLDAYRRVDGMQVEVAPPKVVWVSGGREIDTHEVLYNTQFDLDRSGNAFGVITERNALGLPARIELVNLSEVGVQSIGGQIRYRFGADGYDPHDVWHERQFTVSGLAVGLSPISYAAYSVGAFLSAQEFALDWFGQSAMPAVELVNTQMEIPPDEAGAIKQRYKASAEPGGVFVHGSDWEIKPIQGVNAQNQYVELMQFGVPDIARFFGVPADLIDGSVAGASVTYANLTQRNLQFLIMNLGPAVTRRELAWSSLLPQPRYVKLNRSSLLAMDPQTRATTIKTRLDSRTLAPSEARAIDDLPPFTEAQLAEFDRVYGVPGQPPQPADKAEKL